MRSADSFDPRLTPARPDLAAEELKDRITAPRYARARTATVIRGSVALRSRGDSEAPAASELLFGETFRVYEVRSGWAWGQAGSDGYVGYLEAAALTFHAWRPTHVVTGLFAHLLRAPDIRSSTLALLPMGARLTVVETDAEGLHARIAERDGWVSLRHLTRLGRIEASPLALAHRFLGVPYLWGGKTAAGIDCSGLVQLVHSLAGIDLPRDSDLQRDSLEDGIGRAVRADAAAAGDIAFFPGHVGIMTDARHLIHANATRMAVSIDPLEEVVGWLRRDHAEHPVLGIYRLTVSATGRQAED